jgi:hypothetical protein
VRLLDFISEAPLADDTFDLGRPAWQLRAACRRLGPDWFYDQQNPQPPGVHGPCPTVKIDRERMQRVCGGCPVQEDCFVFGLEGEAHGAWGGRTEQELASIRLELGIALPMAEDEYQDSAGKKRKRPPCGSNAGYQAHRRFEEEACDACRIAHNLETATRKAAKKLETTSS